MWKSGLDTGRKVVYVVTAFLAVALGAVGLLPRQWATADTVQDREWSDIQCYDQWYNYIGEGFECKWAGHDCWYVGPCCPPSWDCSETGIQ